jgi:hypothetical protein
MLRGRISSADLLYNSSIVGGSDLSESAETHEDGGDCHQGGPLAKAHSTNSGITSRAKVLSAANEPPTLMTSTDSTPPVCIRLRRSTIS